MLNTTERLWEKNQKPYEMVSKNYEILTTASIHLEGGIYQILAHWTCPTFIPDVSGIYEQFSGKIDSTPKT
jgi:hypothetical protein